MPVRVPLSFGPWVGFCYRCADQPPSQVHAIANSSDKLSGRKKRKRDGERQAFWLKSGTHPQASATCATLSRENEEGASYGGSFLAPAMEQTTEFCGEQLKMVKLRDGQKLSIGACSYT